MVAQIVTDRRIDADRNSEPIEILRWADSRAHKDSRRMDRACAEDDLAPFDIAPFVSDSYAHSNRSRSVETDAIDQRVTHYLEIGAVARRLQVCVVGRDAYTVAAVVRVRRHAGARGRVMVVGPSVAEPDCGVGQRLVDRAPALARRAMDRDWSAAPVISKISEVLVVFEFYKRRQDLHARPSRASGSGPDVEIFQRRANRDLTVDRGTAAHPAPAPVDNRTLASGAIGPERGPLILRKPADDRAGVRDAHLPWRVVRAIVRSRLEQQHRTRSILREAGGQHGARGASADDDIVVTRFTHASTNVDLTGTCRDLPGPFAMASIQALADKSNVSRLCAAVALGLGCAGILMIASP